MEAEPAVEADIAPVRAVSASGMLEPDVFAIVNEESNAQLVQTTAPVDTHHHHTGSQWVPVEENTFEFEEEVVAEMPTPVISTQTVPVPDESFDDFSFTESAAHPGTPHISAVPEQIFVEPAPDFADFPCLHLSMKNQPSLKRFLLLKRRLPLKNLPPLNQYPLSRMMLHLHHLPLYH